MSLKKTVFVFVTYLMSNTAVWACSCAIWTPSAEWYSSYDVVFTGEVTGVVRAGNPNDYDKYSLNVSEVFKGNLTPATDIVSDYGSCKWNLTVGATYTLFTHTINGEDGVILNASACGPTYYASVVDIDFLRGVFPCSDTLPLGDGWGWDGSMTCEYEGGNTTITECEDPDGDGWGWNGTASCRVEGSVGATECIDPDGDGWGWNGIESCRIDGGPVSAQCIDTDGDGWGWDGSASCRVEPTGATCVDTLPVGDGWGWNGTSSCEP